MAVALDSMKSRTKIITVNWDGEAVDVSYFPNIVTPDLLEQVDEAARRDNLDVVGVMLEPVLDWWDILEHEGGPRLPTDAATIKRVPMSFLNKLQDAIQEDQNPPASSSSAAS
jgi:hypothetical protein